MTLRVAMLGTSWWADSMYLPALRGSTDADVTACLGRDLGRAQDFADRWGIPLATTHLDAALDRCDAVIVGTTNDSHHRLAMAAIERGLHVLCEKPLALTTAEAAEMTRAAADAGVTTMVPFTYRFMPTNQWVKRLIEQGYLGRPFHLNLRYFTGFARSHEYAWRFDRSAAGSGVLGDLGTHWLDLASWLFGPIEEVGAIAARFYERAGRPDGSPYEPTEDSATLTVRFASGAHGTLQVSAVCDEGTAMGQTHHLDAHGSEGTIYSLNDWEATQEVRGRRAEDPGPPAVLPVPDDIWGAARRHSVHDTYRDVFRVNRAMIGDWLDAIAAGRPAEGGQQDDPRRGQHPGEG